MKNAAPKTSVLNPPATGAKIPPKSKVNSPSNTPEEALANAGGMPPEKTETGKGGINDSNDPKKRGYAPGAVHGV